MSTDHASTDSAPTDCPTVIVPTGEPATGSARYHRPAAADTLDAACRTTQLDGQALAPEHAATLGLQPCRCPACFGDQAGAVTPGGDDRE